MSTSKHPEEESVSQGKKFTLEASNLDLQGNILGKIADEVSKMSVKPVNTHIKTSGTDLHGKGNHIKGAGPNYLKDA